MKLPRPFAVALLMITCLFASAVQADDPPSKGEQALKFRKSAFQVRLSSGTQGKPPQSLLAG